ncbi:hypothetical protein GUITHDRAFT_139497 [Guillardia theta CCMP2712]|uniref:F-box domain-containing protein n=1 Tax=Guillardia theta (strain CCMP2712) TaxID=905079 RepID=L1J8P9_GUITC|nr:hypothetical protein GUITHDRAFT_139497 [Guillardia theta CCMP2712]EKX44891.1 hypothetical protein GUITHDRAFT_139497 [Guillardia theta CCMP2712]|eukprot:XP_005831871.1 hypothetical protein GUITHDRAFT_139497 [Guillardia theta CCMP2712]
MFEVLDDDALGKVMEQCNMVDVLLFACSCQRMRMICDGEELWRRKCLECGLRRSSSLWVTEDCESRVGGGGGEGEGEIVSSRRQCLEYFKLNIFEGRRYVEVRGGTEGLLDAMTRCQQECVLLLHPGYYSGSWKIKANTVIIGLNRKSVVLENLQTLGNDIEVNNVTIGNSHAGAAESSNVEYSFHSQHHGTIIRNCDIKGDGGILSAEDSSCLVENCDFETACVSFKGNGVIRDSMFVHQASQRQRYQKSPSIIFYGRGNQLLNSVVHGKYISVLATAGSHCEVGQCNIKAGTYGIFVNGSKSKATKLTINESWYIPSFSVYNFLSSSCLTWFCRVHGCNGAGIYVKGSAAGDIEETNLFKNLIGILVEGWDLPYMKHHRISDRETKTRPRPSINLSGCFLSGNRRNIETISKDHISRSWDLQ